MNDRAVELLRVLVVDDEQPAVDDLVYLLSTEPDVGDITGVGDATAALRHLHEHEVDVVFLDVKMPGLDGIELAKVLSRFARPPSIVFVTAYDEHAVEAFELRVTDYLLKPVRRERLRQALGRVRRIDSTDPDLTAPGVAAGAREHQGRNSLSVLLVESGGRTRLIDRESVSWVESCGDDVRLHGPEFGSLLVRIAMSTWKRPGPPTASSASIAATWWRCVGSRSCGRRSAEVSLCASTGSNCR